VRLGVTLLILSVAYLVQVAAIVANVRQFRTENAAPSVAPDGTIILRHVGFYRFFGTQEAWALAHLTL
jgi:hypothetical protein